MVNRSIQGHKNVRTALRDTETYSSNLQGDADVRDYRQLPLESDPPRHHLYRSALSPMFVRSRINGFESKFRSIAKKILDDFEGKSGGDFVLDVALPFVIECLAVIYNRPQDIDEWLSWGPDVWTADTQGRSGASLHHYLNRVYQEVNINAEEDIWSFVKNLDLDGSEPSYEEFKGIAGVLLAGGRDTVVKLMSGSTWHLLNTPSDVSLLQSGEVSLDSAVQEFLRFFTPLPAMARVPPEQQDLADDERTPSEFATIDFLSANFDSDIFPQPEIIDLKRTRIAHVAFGFGPHTCIGNHIAETETILLLEELLPRISRWNLHEEPQIVWNERLGFKFPERIEKLPIEISH